MFGFNGEMDVVRRVATLIESDGDISMIDGDIQSFVVEPNELEDDKIEQLKNVIDKHTVFDEQGVPTTEDLKAPTTQDRILNSVAVAYIELDGIPVAVATLSDPTIENYKGVVPSDYYELKSGMSLEGRLEQEYFVVRDEFDDMGMSFELRKLLSSFAPNVFAVVSVHDKKIIEGLMKNGYEMISAFETNWDVEPMTLWINSGELVER